MDATRSRIRSTQIFDHLSSALDRSGSAQGGEDAAQMGLRHREEKAQSDIVMVQNDFA